MASDSANFVITADNLSEDVNVLSTQDDELQFIAYRYEEGQALDRPLLMDKFTLNKSKRSRSIRSRLPDDSDMYLLIEQNSDLPATRLEPIVRLYYRKLMELFEQKAYLEMANFIGDEDLLGIYITDRVTTEEQIISFSNTYKMDRYDYEIKLSAR